MATPEQLQSWRDKLAAASIQLALVDDLLAKESTAPSILKAVTRATFSVTEVQAAITKTFNQQRLQQQRKGEQ